jgi:hypothetical protein
VEISVRLVIGRCYCVGGIYGLCIRICVIYCDLIEMYI